MISMFSFESRALRRSTFALASAVALTACDSDAPVGPSSTTSMPSTVNSAIVSTSKPKLMWTVADMNGLLVGGAVFTWSGGKKPVVIADNSLLDADKTPGKFEIAVSGTGQVCPVSAPTGWVMPDMKCQAAGPITGPVNLQSVFVLPEYSMIWHTNFSAGGQIGGAEYTIKSKDGSYTALITDNGKLDRWPTLGSYFVQLPKGGDYELCQTTPAPGTVMYDAPCHAVTVNFGSYSNGGVFVNWPSPI